MEKVSSAHGQCFIGDRRCDKAQQESHIPDVTAVKAAPWLKAAEEIKSLLSKTSPHFESHNII